MINYTEDIKGYFNDTNDVIKETILEIVGNFHIRNGVKQLDNSMGVIDITLKQFNDCLAYMVKINEF